MRMNTLNGRFLMYYLLLDIYMWVSKLLRSIANESVLDHVLWLVNTKNCHCKFLLNINCPRLLLN